MKKVLCIATMLCTMFILSAVPVLAQDSDNKVVTIKEFDKPINVYEDTTLVMDNAVYRGNEPAIALHNDAKVTLVLKGNSVIEREADQSEGMYSAIFLNDNSQLVIVDDPDEKDQGSLELKNWDFGICAGTTNVGSSIQVEGVSLLIDSTLSGICNMNGNTDEIAIRNADVNVKNTQLVGIGSYFGGDLKNLSIENSNINVDSGLVGIGSDQAAVENISINNSKFKVNSKLVGIGGRDADISKMTISNSIGNVIAADESDQPFVGIGMATGVAGGLSGNGYVRVYTVEELTLINNLLLVDSPVTGIGAARKVLDNGETGTSIKNLNIQGGFIVTKIDDVNGVCVGAKDLNIENISIQNGCLTTLDKGTALGCVDYESNSEYVSEPTSISMEGKTKVVALCDKNFVPERNILHQDEKAKIINEISMDESQMDAAVEELQTAINGMNKPGEEFTGDIEELKNYVESTEGSNLENLKELLDIYENILKDPEPDEIPENPVDPENPADPDNTVDPENQADPDKSVDVENPVGADGPEVIVTKVEKAPKTADESPVTMWTMLLLGAAGTIAAVKRKEAR